MFCWCKNFLISLLFFSISYKSVSIFQVFQANSALLHLKRTYVIVAISLQLRVKPYPHRKLFSCNFQLSIWQKKMHFNFNYSSCLNCCYNGSSFTHTIRTCTFAILFSCFQCEELQRLCIWLWVLSKCGWPTAQCCVWKNPDTGASAELLRGGSLCLLHSF